MYLYNHKLNIIIVCGKMIHQLNNGMRLWKINYGKIDTNNKNFLSIIRW